MVPPLPPRLLVFGAADLAAQLRTKIIEQSVRSFTLNAHALADWVNAHDGQMPRLSRAKDPEEGRHGAFLSYCRQAARGGQGASTFTAERRALLDRLVPGWEGADPETVFAGHVHALADWMNTHDRRMPRLSRAKDPEEGRHGAFLSYCRQAARGGQGASTFTAERRALLDRLVPGWEGADPETVFAGHVHQLADWMLTHDGRIPSKRTKDPVARRHGQFLSNCRRAARGGQGASTFTAERRALLDRLVPGWEGEGPDAIFDRNVRDLAGWVNAHDGRMPRLSGRVKDPVEPRHGKFLSHCRQAARGGQGASTFTAERQALLDRLVPGWDIDRDTVFSGHVHELAGWVNAHDGRIPSQTAGDPVERRHGRFLGTCRQAARGHGGGANAFTAERRALLDRLVPGWEGVDPDTIFDRNVRELAGWVNAHDGRMPRQQAKDPVERRHGKFLKTCRQAARGGRGANAFSAERRALLDRLVPGWEGRERR